MSNGHSYQVHSDQAPHHGSIFRLLSTDCLMSRVGLWPRRALMPRHATERRVKTATSDTPRQPSLYRCCCCCCCCQSPHHRCGLASALMSYATQRQVLATAPQSQIGDRLLQVPQQLYCDERSNEIRSYQQLTWPQSLDDFSDLKMIHARYLYCIELLSLTSSTPATARRHVHCDNDINIR